MGFFTGCKSPVHRTHPRHNQYTKHAPTHAARGNPLAATTRRHKHYLHHTEAGKPNAQRATQPPPSPHPLTPTFAHPHTFAGPDGDAAAAPAPSAAPMSTSPSASRPCGAPPPAPAPAPFPAPRPVAAAALSVFMTPVRNLEHAVLDSCALRYVAEGGVSRANTAGCRGENRRYLQATHTRDRRRYISTTRHHTNHTHVTRGLQSLTPTACSSPKYGLVLFTGSSEPPSCRPVYPKLNLLSSTGLAGVSATAGTSVATVFTASPLNVNVAVISMV